MYELALYGGRQHADCFRRNPDRGILSGYGMEIVSGTVSSFARGRTLGGYPASEEYDIGL